MFDLDDTLISTSRVYYDIQIKTIAYFLECSEPYARPPREFLDVLRMIRQGELDKSQSSEVYSSLGMNEYAGSPELFPKSLTEAFIECMLRAGVYPTREQAEHVYELGMSIFSAEYKLLPGARKLVEYLDRRSDTLVFILTQGSPNLQKPKVSGRKLFKKIQKILVVPITTSKNIGLRALKEEYEDVDTWIMVGDSTTRDINPALVEGIVAVHITNAMSDLEDSYVIDIGDTRKRYLPVHNLYEAEKVLKEAVYGKKLSV